MAKAKQPSSTDRFIESLIISEEGRIQIPNDEFSRYQGMIQAATRLKKIPEGKQIRLDGYTGSSRPSWAILEDLPAWKLVKPLPVEIPEKLRKPGEVVQSLRNREDFRIQRSERNRALRLIEALVREARRRGYTVNPTPAPRRDRSGFLIHERDQGHFTITIESDEYALSMFQPDERVPHVLTKTESDDAARGHWVPKYDTVTSSRLQIRVEKESYDGVTSWKDTPNKPLDDLLPLVLQELEMRHLRAVERRERERKELEERQARWEAARLRAITCLNESHRTSMLIKQLEAWELASRLEPFIEAMEQHISQDSTLKHPEGAREWLEWAKEYARTLNPLTSGLSMPADPQPTAEALAPYLRGHNPHGPWD